MKQHIEMDDLKAFHQGTLLDQQEKALLEHIGDCDYCATLFAQSFEHDLAHMPDNLKEAIIEKSQYVKTDQQTLKEKFYRYCIQVSVTVCFSLVLVLFPVEDTSFRFRDYNPSRYLKQLQQEINSHTENINKFGGFYHDTKKK